MALQVPSGLVTAASGLNSPPMITSPVPIVIVGAGLGLSGLHTITDNSGALNINVSGGSITTSISGNVVLVTSGGTVQVSGNVTTVSGSVTQAVLSGTAFDSAANPRLNISVWNGGNEMSITGGAGVGDGTSASQNFAFVASNNLLLDAAGNLDKMRSVTGSSGGSLGVLATQVVGYSYTNATGAAVTNVKSGAAFLHAVNFNQYGFSGTQVQIRDSASGVAGTLIGTIGGQLSGQSVLPTSLHYDALVTSGIVISTSGAGWDLTVVWRTATS